MKLKGVYVNGKCYDTVEQFRTGTGARTFLGRLVIALAEEAVWSVEYSVSALICFGPPAVLFINHAVLDLPIEITSTDWRDWNVQRVEDAIRNHLAQLTNAGRKELSTLQARVSALEAAGTNIDNRKARVASQAPT